MSTFCVNYFQIALVLKFLEVESEIGTRWQALHELKRTAVYERKSGVAIPFDGRRG